MSESGAYYLSGNFGPVHEEVTAQDLPVIGSLPEELDGRYLRIGPNPVDPQDPATYHWFTGDGMAHGVRLRGGKAEWYRNRFIRSTHVSEVLGEEPKPGERHMFDTVNTNILPIGGRTHALVEAGARPVELTDELETVCHSDLGGGLPNGYTAHPKLDPVTGELHAISYFFGLGNQVQYTVIGRDGRVKKLEPITTKGSPMVHDCSLTESSVVVYDMPVVFDLEMAASGARLPYRWDDSYGSHLGVVPRDGTDADTVWFEVEPCYVFHPLNAFDDGDHIVLDVVRHPKMFDTHKLGPNEGPPMLWRWTLDRSSGVVKEEQLSDHPMEFPRVDERVVGRQHRYGYGTAADPADPRPLAGANLVKHDLLKGTSVMHDFGASCTAGEGVFVPRSADAAEDDGWVMTIVYEATTDSSELVLLDAQDYLGEPVARVQLPQRVPFGFHGNWVGN
jgi:carotenoid cleavage dioxygenase